MSTRTIRPAPPGLGRRLLSFVVVADTHVNERDGDSNSPFLTNRLANERARYVFQDIAAMSPQPAFVVHLGDIVHPTPSLPGYQEATGQFRSMTAPLTVPLHLVPGNHDVGDKRIDWMPADQVNDQYLEIYRKAFGADFHAFDHGRLRFVFVNSLLLNSGLNDEQVQREWLEAQLDCAGDMRAFVFMHYPPYIHSVDERGNYDNVDEPARSWLLEQLRQPGVEGVFAGHVHNFWYDRVGEAELYMLPSTAFLRHDFSEFYRVAPAEEFGRGDTDKFGYFVIDVFEQGHIAYPIRTRGRRAQARGQAPSPAPDRHLVHPKSSSFEQVGVELRHPWTESMQITATGGVQEFGRKWARNDYPLLALWEMGVRLAKVPDIDLLGEQSRHRMQLMARLGCRYLVTVLGAPKPALAQLDLHASGVAAFEMNTTLDDFERQRARAKALREGSGCAIYLAPIPGYDGSSFDGKHFSHVIKAGLDIDGLETHGTLIAQACAAGEIDGVTVRIGPDQPLVACATVLDDFSRRHGCRVLASLKLAGPSLAAARNDDRGNVARVAQAMVLSRTSPSVHYVFDTFMDVDRGYFPRQAFIDGQFNPRPAARAFALLNSLLSDCDELKLLDPSPSGDVLPGDASPGNPASGNASTPSGVVLRFQADAHRYTLWCGPATALHPHLERLTHAQAVHDLIDTERCVEAGGIAALCERLTDSEQNGSALQVLLFREP